MLASKLIPGDLSRAFPIVTPGAASDSASFDEVLELLHLGGRSLPHAVMMMIPEAWENNATMDPAIRGFAEFHASLIEPWDGPACVTFTDGTVLGAVLDRNGLRPGRWWLTSDDTVVLASEAGVLPIAPEKVVERGRLQPGRMFLVDTDQGRILNDAEVKAALAAEHPYRDWVHAGLMRLTELPPREHVTVSHRSVLARQRIFGYTEEELRILVTPMAATGAEGIGSMGTDTPEAVLSQRPRLIFDYFTQLFAQVTNPPLDAIREAVVTSLASVIGPEANLLEPGPWSCRQVVLPFPVLDNDDLAKLMGMNADGNLPGLRLGHHLRPVRRRRRALRPWPRRSSDVGWRPTRPSPRGARVIMLSDRHSTADRAPIPSLLLTSAVHQHLVRQKSRTKVALVVESGDAREVHHIALLLGYGAGAVNPYLVLETAEDLSRHGLLGDVTPEKAVKNIVYALGKGVLKVMSKMGISTVGSYRAAQVFAVVRPQPGRAGRVLHRQHHPHRRQRPGHHRRRRGDPARPGLRAEPAHPGAPRPGDRRPVPVAPRGRDPPVQPGDRVPAAALHPQQAAEGLPPVHRDGGQAVPQGGTLRGLFELRTDERPRRCRWRRSSRRRRSSSGSSPARCPTARSPSRRTRRWPSR